MTLVQISSFINQALRNKLSASQILLLINNAHKMAFDNNLQAFLVWTETLTPYFYLEFLASGYTSAVAGDIGKTVTDGTASGVLISYDNTTRKWLVETTEEFEDSGAVTITTGTGAGTLIATDSQVGYVGPYSAPTTIPCRKIWGVTKDTDKQIFGVDTETTSDDFNFVSNVYDPSTLLENGREDNVTKTFTFIDEPAFETDYRWIYWRNPEDITAISQDSKFLIPETYHFHFINACIKIAQITIFGEDVPPEVLKTLFKPWWDTLYDPYKPMGTNSNRSLRKTGSSSVII